MASLKTSTKSKGRLLLLLGIVISLLVITANTGTQAAPRYKAQDWVTTNDPDEGYLIDAKFVALDNDENLFIGVATYEGWDNAFLQSDDSISFWLETDQNATTGATGWLTFRGIAPDYSIWVDYNPITDSLQAEVWRYLSESDFSKVGEFPVVHNNGKNTMVIGVPMSNIGNPQSISWFAAIHNEIGSGGEVQFDTIPDSGCISYQVQTVPSTTPQTTLPDTTIPTTTPPTTAPSTTTTTLPPTTTTSSPITTVLGTTVPTAPQPSFSDVPSNAWFNSYVVNLAIKGIIGGYPDRTFKPQNSITRAEFAKIIVLAAGRTPSSASSSFKDVATSYWARGYIERAKELGIIDGYPDGTFKSNNNISRQEIAKLVVLANGSAPSETFKASFSDVSSKLWSWPYVIKASELGFVTGYPNKTFRPHNAATRAEASKMVSGVKSGATIIRPTTTTTKAPPTTVTTTKPPATKLFIDIISVTSPVSPGQNATLVAKATPGASCTITVNYKSGPSKAKGLEPKYADRNGRVSWTWMVGTRTTAGSWPITVTASIGGKTITASTRFTVK